MEPPNQLANALQRELVRRDLLEPALVLLVSHRPLAFAASQLLHLLEPLAGVAGWPGLAQWATLLDQPDGLAQLERAWHNHSPLTRGDLHEDSRSKPQG